MENFIFCAVLYSEVEGFSHKMLLKHKMQVKKNYIINRPICLTCEEKKLKGDSQIYFFMKYLIWRWVVESEK